MTCGVGLRAVVRLLDTATALLRVGGPPFRLVLVDRLDDVGVPLADPGEVKVADLSGAPSAQTCPADDGVEQRRLM